MWSHHPCAELGALRTSGFDYWKQKPANACRNEHIRAKNRSWFHYVCSTILNQYFFWICQPTTGLYECQNTVGFTTAQLEQTCVQRRKMHTGTRKATDHTMVALSDRSCASSKLHATPHCAASRQQQPRPAKAMGGGEETGGHQGLH